MLYGSCQEAESEAENEGSKRSALRRQTLAFEYFNEPDDERDRADAGDE
jgi:hypothetical protein